VWYLVWNLCCTVTTNSALGKFMKKNTILSPVLVMFGHDCPLVVKPASTPLHLLPKQTWRNSLPTGILLPTVSLLVVALLNSEIPVGLMNYPV
jgi:hypothetical protein